MTVEKEVLPFGWYSGYYLSVFLVSRMTFLPDFNFCSFSSSSSVIHFSKKRLFYLRKSYGEGIV